MSDNFSFSEFYQKTPIPIKENVLLLLQSDDKFAVLSEQSTHWLIALEGCELGATPLQWRVGVYLSNQDGCFDYRLPYYRSTFVSTFNEALEMLRVIERKAHQDELLMLHP